MASSAKRTHKLPVAAKKVKDRLMEGDKGRVDLSRVRIPTLDELYRGVKALYVLIQFAEFYSKPVRRTRLSRSKARALAKHDQLLVDDKSLW